MAWIRYKNLSGKSSVRYYIIYNNSILLSFKGGEQYRYTYSSTLSMLKSLARAGRGLNTYINKHYVGSEQL